MATLRPLTVSESMEFAVESVAGIMSMARLSSEALWMPPAH